MRVLAVLLVLTLGLAGAMLPCSRAEASGFDGPGVATTVTRAADVLGAQDDAPCVLEGHILEKLPRRKNRYLFEDQSGKVVVEIKNEVFGHLTVTPRDKVRLLGHVDWNRKRPNEVEVDGLSIIGIVDARDVPER
ncbi:MAG: Protein YgiW [Desulfovibrio sp.]